MATIPADPTMVLGQIVSKERLDFLQEVSKALGHQERARDKYNAYKLASHNLQGLFLELSNMDNVTEADLEPMKTQITEVNKQLITESLALAKATIKAQTDVAKLKADKNQSSIGVAPESPFDMTQVQIAGKPVSMDTMNFDVQYFRTETQDDGQKSPADIVSAFIQKALAGGGDSGGGDTGAAVANKANKATANQHSSHKVEGTLVIVCNCTHKMANFINGTLDGKKALDAWNQMYPDAADYLDTDGTTLMKVATEKSAGDKGKSAGGKGKSAGGKGEKALHILTGTTFASSFVGLAHVLEKEETEKSDDNTASVDALAGLIKTEMLTRELTGNFGVSPDFLKTAKSLTSKSEIIAHCSLICMGAIPGFKSKSHETFVNQMAPSTMKTLQKIDAINSKKEVGGGDDSDVASAKLGAQVMSAEENFLNSAGDSLNKPTANLNYYDMDSMMEAFENYLAIVNGKDQTIGGGIPNNFYLKKLTKKDVAKAYLAQFYPNGVGLLSGDFKAMTGQMKSGGGAGEGAGEGGKP
mmetsp:Transcript_2346/g.3576  ORF Transcript_2346/g.3576 Transcript_2346/m.3576 type:complete len:528 (+) Transcript_2346:34-1617(+)|eukprot:CAMPEP_0194250796 /NCGR_PEP_ID=MMETSP0158-20130606/23932_1 /TAXON_ID=33649 /ORGANISM="Thalassionema nitzschioides, Strain L26-B" /LENGTH=527 /DNA_ID=CAMNT_0038987717 /DNA_START=34 /DNA_END=1617 /DNA_ORIENTATION=-